MASLWFDERGASWTVCFTVFEGQARRQVKRAVGTTDRRLAMRVALELEEAAQGRRTREELLPFLNSITDLRARRWSTRAVDAALRRATGAGLESKATRTFIEDWLARTEPEVAPATLARYRQVAQAFLESLSSSRADSDIATITAADVVRFRDAEARRVSGTTANIHLKILRVILGAAEADGAVPKNPARFVKTIKVRDAGVRRPFTVEELKRLLEAADPEWRSMILFGFYTGLRLADVATLRWENVDPQRGELRLVTGKTGRRVVIPLAKPLLDHVGQLPAADLASVPLHPRAAGILSRQGARVGTLSNQFAELLATAGLAKSRSHKPDGASGSGEGRRRRRQASEVSFHSLRHSFVSALKASGAGEAVAMDLAGHESAEVSRHYTTIDAATKRAALDRLPALE